MLVVSCFKWKPHAGYRSEFRPETVNVLRAMVARHYPDPHAFVCITDDARGIDPDIRIVPLWSDFASVPSPHGGKNPSCYRRLKLFSAEAQQILGPRFVNLDLDCVITGDLRPLWNRPEDFMAWGDTHPRTYYNGSMILMTAGARKQVWETFDPARSPKLSMQAGCYGSDQGWISYCLGPKEAKWTKADGVYSYRNHLKTVTGLPGNARMVMFHGSDDPWMPRVQARHPWIAQHWVGRLAVSA